MSLLPKVIFSNISKHKTICLGDIPLFPEIFGFEFGYGLAYFFACELDFGKYPTDFDKPGVRVVGLSFIIEMGIRPSDLFVLFDVASDAIVNHVEECPRKSFVLLMKADGVSVCFSAFRLVVYRN